MRISVLIFLLPLLSSPALAASCRRRSKHISSSDGPSRTDEASEAKITSPVEECTPYNYEPSAKLIDLYPTVWELANLSKADDTTKQLFNSIVEHVPNIAPRGIPDGDPTAAMEEYEKLYGNTDPECWWTSSTCTKPKLEGLAEDITFCPEPNTWGLTLDDGPNCSHNAYFDFLAKHKYKATLFYIGSNVLDWPLEAQRGLADGHEICTHTWSHKYMTSLSNEEVFAELYYSKKIIHDLLGVTVRCWRPPYGDVDDRVRYIASSLDMATIIWEHDTDDWMISENGPAHASEMYKEIIGNATEGKFNSQGIIVLTHEVDEYTMAMSKKYLPKISKAFKHVAPVGVCHNNSHPYIEQNYRYPTFAEWADGKRQYSNPKPEVTISELQIPTTGRQGTAGTEFGSEK